jgi:dipeptidase E
MKLYLSSIGVPTPDDLALLLGKPLSTTSVAFIPNANDYYAERPRSVVTKQRVAPLESLGMKVTVIDLRDYSDGAALEKALQPYDLIWVTGGNTFLLRDEIRKSGFERIIHGLLNQGKVYGGNSAGALVAGDSIGDIDLDSADPPEFAAELIEEGLHLVPYIIVPHVNNLEFTEVMKTVAKRVDRADKFIELKDSQAVVFDGDEHRIVGATV